MASASPAPGPHPVPGTMLLAGGDVDASLRADNTSAFNCRRSDTGYPSEPYRRLRA